MQYATEPLHIVATPAPMRQNITDALNGLVQLRSICFAFVGSLLSVPTYNNWHSTCQALAMVYIAIAEELTSTINQAYC